MFKISNNFLFLIILFFNGKCILSKSVNNNNSDIEIRAFHRKVWYNNGENCNLNINQDISIASSPLFLRSDKNDFIRASDTKGNIQIEKGQEILVACPGRNNRFKNFNRNETRIVCVGGKNFKFPNGSSYNAKSIECLRWPSSVLKTIGKCLSGYNLYQTGFELSIGFVPLFEFCYDTKMMNTLYTKFILTKESANSQKNVARPSWQSGNLYGKVPVDLLYKRDQQRITFSKLLGSTELAEKYIHPSNDYFLARGHMVAKGDFFYGAQQVNTFWYGNAAPQWQTFNGQNWKSIEMAVRYFVGKYNQDLDVYTGIFDNDFLPNIHGSKMKLSLNGNGQIPVPMMYWKIVHDPKRNLGVTIVGLNSPYINSTDIKKNILCTDICDQLHWLNVSTSERKDPKQGYLYCCDVNEFYKKVNNMPSIKVVGILK